MTVVVEVLYAPTCADSLMWLVKIRKALKAFGDDVELEEVDVTEHPEVLKGYESRAWQEFTDGYTHYLTVVAVNGKALEGWYWDTGKIADAVRRELQRSRKSVAPKNVATSFF